MEKPVRLFHVEDDPDIRNVVRISLTMLGNFELDQFVDGTEAVASAPIMSADLFLLDVMMPGMNGFETLEKLRRFSHFRTTPAILFSAKSIIIPEGQNAADLGIIGTIRKPFDPTTLPGQILEMWQDASEPVRMRRASAG